MKNKKYILGLVLGSLLAVNIPFTSFAANGVTLEKSNVTIPFEQIVKVPIKYTGYFEDLTFTVRDADIVSAVLTDQGNGNACLSIASNGFGRTVVAVCKQSDLSAVDYVTVNSGMTSGSKIENYFFGTDIVTAYNDCVIEYGFTLNGKNNATAAFTGLNLCRENALDRLEVTATIQTDDSVMPGMQTFTAYFYDGDNNLIKTANSFVRGKIGKESYICWYIPEDCVTIVLD